MKVTVTLTITRDIDIEHNIERMDYDDNSEGENEYNAALENFDYVEAAEEQVYESMEDFIEDARRSEIDIVAVISR